MSLITRRPQTACTAGGGVPETVRARASGGRIPWGTIVPLAVTLALADAFWMVTLRGAVGAVERTQQPFLSWLRDSLLALPLATLAVLLALTAARRWLEPRRRFGFLTTWLLVVGFGTVAGVAQVAVSAIYDYVLQTENNLMMVTGGGMCTRADCLERMQHATLGLQFKAFGYGVVLILVTNLVVTLWVIAVRGGRLDVVSRRRSAPRVQTLPQSLREPQGHAGLAPDIRLLLAVLLVSTAAIHAAVVPEHLAEWPGAGAFFVALGLAEGALAVALLLRPGRLTRSSQLVVTVLVSGAPLVLWVYSRLVGLPLGPSVGVREPVGATDAVASLLELGTLLIALACLRDGSRLRLLPALSPVSRAAGFLAVTAMSATAIQTLGLRFGPM